MDFRGYVPPEAIALLVMGAIIGGYVFYQIGAFVLRHIQLI